MTDPLNPDLEFALTHVPTADRAAVSALWALDARLGSLVANTTQPMIGQMRMTWWHQALTTLKPGEQRGEPVLDALAETVVGTNGIDGAALARLVEGWEVLLEPLPLDGAALSTYADARGGVVFALTAQLLGRPIENTAGRGWALADFALRCSDVETAQRARTLATEAFSATRLRQLPRPLRALARLSSGDVQRGARSERTFWRLMASIR